jgi:hypothetical protein
MKIMYLRDNGGRPVGCIIIGKNMSTQTFEYQFSVLNPVETFNRNRGRAVASGRLLKKPIPINVPSPASMHDITFAVMTSIAATKGAPTRAVNAAKSWLIWNTDNETGLKRVKSNKDYLINKSA